MYFQNTMIMVTVMMTFVTLTYGFRFLEFEQTPSKMDDDFLGGMVRSVKDLMGLSPPPPPKTLMERFFDDPVGSTTGMLHSLNPWRKEPQPPPTMNERLWMCLKGMDSCDRTALTVVTVVVVYNSVVILIIIGLVMKIRTNKRLGNSVSVQVGAPGFRLNDASEQTEEDWTNEALVKKYANGMDRMRAEIWKWDMQKEALRNKAVELTNDKTEMVKYNSKVDQEIEKTMATVKKIDEANQTLSEKIKELEMKITEEKGNIAKEGVGLDELRPLKSVMAIQSAKAVALPKLPKLNKSTETTPKKVKFLIDESPKLKLPRVQDAVRGF